LGSENNIGGNRRAARQGGIREEGEKIGRGKRKAGGKGREEIWERGEKEGKITEKGK
jgi:hypothetical protein